MNMALGDARQIWSGARARLGDAQILQRAQAAADRLGDRGLAQLAGAAAVGFVVGAGALRVRRLAMQASTGVAGDWLATLKADHKAVDGLFVVLLKTRDKETARRQVLISKIAYALAKHQFEEEHVIYPALRNGGRPETPKHLDAEHFDMKSMVHELLEMPKDDPRWIKKARGLHKLISEHVREEEEIVFPALYGRLSKAENAKLTRAMHREGLKLA